ncbi:MAG: hypothetical protein IMZ53_06985, partial [Thermoplasmata archaeon]|nr:hypothetical protein [Thermoplasmata archaeon]
MKLPLIIVRQQDLPLTNERLNKCAKIILDQLIDPQLNNYRIYEGQIMIKNTKRIGVGTTKKGEYAVLDDYIRLVFHCIPSDEKIYFTKEIYCGLVYDIKSNLHEHGYEYAKNKTYYAKNPIRLIRCVDCQKNVYVHNRIIRCLDCKDKYEKQNKKVRDKQRIGLD